LTKAWTALRSSFWPVTTIPWSAPLWEAGGGAAIAAASKMLRINAKLAFYDTLTLRRSA
jgi:hypothetical protein